MIKILYYVNEIKFHQICPPHYLLGRIFYLSFFFSLLLGYDINAQCGAQDFTIQMQKDFPNTFTNNVYSLNRERGIETRSSGIPYIIPVVWHVFHNKGSGKMSKAQVVTAIEVLNDNFSGTSIEFQLAKIDPDGYCTDGIVFNTTLTPYGSRNTIMDLGNLKDVSHWDNTKYLNIYSVLNMVAGDNYTFDSDTEGYAFLPCSPNAGTAFNGFNCYTPGSDPYFFDKVDGVVIRYNLPEILAHEVGHYLGLFHTWGPDSYSSLTPWWIECHGMPCAENGDFICDTNPMVRNTAYTNCSNNTCDSLDAFHDPTDNYMSYTKVCWSKFTSEQIVRMKSILENQRPLIHSTPNILASGIKNFIEDTEINTNTTWSTSTLPNDGDVRSGNINIYNGATLNINSGVIVTMCKNSKIFVHPGGKLNLKGTVRSDIPGDWDGIIVHGSTSTHTAGIVSCNSPAKIINAKIGIESVNNSNLNGGKISASNTEFKDNIIAVKATSYNSDTNISGNFKNCNFNNDIEGFVRFVELYKIINVSFKSCTFENNYTLNAIDRIGILARSSSFNIGEQFLIDGIPNGGTFYGLHYGIRPSTNKSYNIAHAIFNNCAYGVYNLSTNSGKIVYNTFNLQDSYIDSNRYGIFINGLNSSLSIQENTFNGSTSLSGGLKTIGVLHDNTLSIDKYVRRNTFTSVNYGCQAINKNATNTPGPVHGLRYTCNAYTSGEKDIYPSTSDDNVINKNQKAFQLVPDLYVLGQFNMEDRVAGNKFYGSTYSGYRSIDNQMTIPINYWHRDGYDEIPINSYNIIPYLDDRYYCAIEEADSYEPPKEELGLLGLTSENELNDEYDKTKEMITLLQEELDRNSKKWSAEQIDDHQNKISNLNHYLSLTNTKLINVLLNSSTYPDNIEDVYSKLARENKYGTDLWLLKEFISIADWSRAESLLQKMTSQYTSSDDSEDIGTVISLLQILNDKKVLSENDIYSIQAIADTYRGNGALWAQAILTGYGYLYHPIISKDAIDKPVLPVSKYQLSNENIEIYPNPASTELNVNIKYKVHNASIEVKSMTGMSYITAETTEGINQIDIQALQTGMYILIVKDESGILQTYKFIKN